MKRFVMALVLMCALSTSILAGDMPTGGKSEQPPPPQLAGNMPTGGKAEELPPSISSTLLVSVIVTLIRLR